MGTFHLTNLTVVRSETPAVRFEPCSEFHDEPANEGSGTGSCAGCGWLADDHDLAGAPVAA
jgi:hypothetical protein